jgi:hypothetical protein
MEIFSTNDTFDFEKLVMTKPTSISGGNYFIRCLVNNQPLYIQPPKCKTKQGIVKAGIGKRLYTDLMFTNENEDFIRWMENLETYSQQYIFKNREKWFDGEMEMHDIENYFTSPLKVFKSGKYYIVRTSINAVLGKPSLKIYDENENEVEFDSINDNTNIMTILEIQGIKCSSKSFQIEIELKQMMVLQPTNIFEKCVITTSRPTARVETTSLVDNSCNEVLVYREEVEVEEETPSEKVDETLPILEKDDEDKCDAEPEIVINDEDIKDTAIVIKDDGTGLEEVEFDLEVLNQGEPISIKKRDSIYYEMYQEARKKAKIARDLALSAYLEAKRIKNTYMLDDIEDEDEDEYEDDYEDEEDEDEEEDEDDYEEDNYEEEKKEEGNINERNI